MLNGGSLVSPDAAEAVRAAMERTRYVASHSARSLNTRRSGAVALVVAEGQSRLFEDPTTSTLFRGLNAGLAEHGQTLYLTLADDDRTRRSLVTQLRSGLLDGAILTSVHGNDPLYAMVLEGDPAPAVVMSGQPLGAGRRLPYVTVRDRSAARRVTRHLLERGRRHLGIVAGPQDTGSGRERLRGFRSAFDETAAATGVVAYEAMTTGYSEQEGERAMIALLEQAPRLDAVFVASDLLATGALVSLRRLGRRVPDDVAVAGFDDSVLAREAQPALTTVRIPFELATQELVRLLLARIAGEDPAPVRLDCELVVRDST
ncbi:LacI family DNA-binding transcriptional regulator [Acidothermaceae bacterium B102]|nr:LacI family DNA-binding transcriptional regulator [Acidothermaceae bacterium B102]